jgi:hypothetical protein
MRILSILLLAAVAGLATAQPQDASSASLAPSPNAYAARWPLQLPAAATAGAFTLDPALHALLEDPAFGDLQVFDATGTAMPMARASDTAAAQWLRVGFASAGPAEGAAGDAGVMAYAYALPVELAASGARVVVRATTGDSALQYRSGGVWQTAARLPAGAGPASVAAGSPAAANEATFAAPVAATEWRVISGRALSPSPVLELSVRPARFAFLARGTPPYLLAAGHAVARHADVPEAAAAAAQAATATIGARLTASFVPAVPIAAAGPGWLRLAGWCAAGACVMGAGWFLLRRRRGVLAAV